MNDDSDGGSDDGVRARAGTSWALNAAVIVLPIVVMALFSHALVVARPGDGVVLVVIGDPAPVPETLTALRVLALHRERPVAVLRARVNGFPLDERGFGSVIAGSHDGQVTGMARTVDGDRHELDLRLLPTKDVVATTTTTTPWTTALALPAAGAHVYPEHGLVAGRGRSRVVLVGDTTEVVEVEPLVDARLPDGRLLAIDRQPLQLSIDDDALLDRKLVVAFSAREAIDGVIDVWVGGRLVEIDPIAIAAGQTTWTWPHELMGKTGDLVVVNVALSPVPSAARRQGLARVGGWHDDELLLVEPRAASHLGDPLVRRAIASRFVVDGARPVVLSPSFAEQERAWHQRATHDAIEARQRFRHAIGIMLGVLAFLALLARVRLLHTVAALVIVAVVGGGLDAVLGLSIDDTDDAIGEPTTWGSP